MKEIAPGIWLGGCIECDQTLPTVHLGQDCLHIQNDPRNLVFDLLDTDDHAPRILGILDQSYAFITKWRTVKPGVFIHCTAGVSRSATLIFLYLHRTGEVKTINDYRRICPQWFPNLGFQRLFRDLDIF